MSRLLSSVQKRSATSQFPPQTAQIAVLLQVEHLTPAFQARETASPIRADRGALRRHAVGQNEE